MEEIITLDGRQFKLTVDRPLTATERAQVLADIRKQTGCGTCGPRPLSMGYGGIQSLAACATGPKTAGQTITLAAAPNGGTFPYTVRFWRKSAPGGYTTVGTQTPGTEGATVSTSFVVTDADVTGAVGDATASVPTTGPTGAVSDTEGGGATLSALAIRVAATTTDSCPTSAQSCIEWCDVSLTCPAPTCNFVVS